MIFRSKGDGMSDGRGNNPGDCGFEVQLMTGPIGRMKGSTFSPTWLASSGMPARWRYSFR